MSKPPGSQVSSRRLRRKLKGEVQRKTYLITWFRQIQLSASQFLRLARQLFAKITAPKTSGDRHKGTKRSRSGIAKFFTVLRRLLAWIWNWSLTPPNFARILLVAIGVIAIQAYFALTRPSASANNCQSQINGKWQSNRGEVTFAEEARSNKITAVFSYQNIDRGMVKGKLEGELGGDTLEFSWQEQAERGKPKTTGKGIVLFRNTCQEFFGGYSLSSFSSQGWHGNLVKRVAVK